MKKFFIAGVPASGKTRFGEYLAEHHDFYHINVENEEGVAALSELLSHGDVVVQHAGKENSVITWGFDPDDPRSIEAVKALQANGFRVIWFTAPYDQAKEAFIRRKHEEGWGDEEAFEIQMKRIAALDLSRFGKVTVIETLSRAGRKSFEDIYAELLSLK